MSGELPRCMRLIVTAIYADGTSTILDIPEPDKITDELNTVGLGPSEFDFGRESLMPAEDLEIVIKATRKASISKREVIKSVIPVPGPVWPGGANEQFRS